jgi:hypothetical protein
MSEIAALGKLPATRATVGLYPHESAASAASQPGAPKLKR